MDGNWIDDRGQQKKCSSITNWFYDKQGEFGFVHLELAGIHKLSRHTMIVPRNSVHVNAASSAWNGWSIHRSNCWTANSLRFDYNNVTLHRDVRNNASNAHEEVENELHSDKKAQFQYLLVCSFRLSFSRDRFTIKKKLRVSFNFLQRQSHFLKGR